MDVLGHLPSLIRDFVVLMKKPWVLSFPFSNKEFDQTARNEQADINLRWAHISFCWFYRDAVQSLSLIHLEHIPGILSIAIIVLFLYSQCFVSKGCHEFTNLIYEPFYCQFTSLEAQKLKPNSIVCPTLLIVGNPI